MQRRHRPTYPRRPIIRNWSVWPVPMSEWLALVDEEILAHRALVEEMSGVHPMSRGQAGDDHATHLALHQEFTPHA